MSRTLRRKHYESENPKSRGFKTAGFYTEYDHYCETSNGHGGYWIFREPTQQERDRKYWLIHSESKDGNARGPGRWYKQRKEKLNRRANTRELHRYLTRDYEPFFTDNPKKNWDSYYW
jgi:hypothetical protein